MRRANIQAPSFILYPVTLPLEWAQTRVLCVEQFSVFFVERSVRIDVCEHCSFASTQVLLSIVPLRFGAHLKRALGWRNYLRESLIAIEPIVPLKKLDQTIDVRHRGLQTATKWSVTPGYSLSGR